VCVSVFVCVCVSLEGLETIECQLDVLHLRLTHQLHVCVCAFECAAFECAVVCVYVCVCVCVCVVLCVQECRRPADHPKSIRYCSSQTHTQVACVCVRVGEGMVVRVCVGEREKYRRPCDYQIHLPCFSFRTHHKLHVCMCVCKRE